MIDRAAGRDLSGAGRTYRGHTGAMVRFIFVLLRVVVVLLLLLSLLLLLLLLLSVLLLLSHIRADAANPGLASTVLSSVPIIPLLVLHSKRRPAIVES